MAITAEEIQNVSFSIDRKGYDVDEVDVFLEHVAEEVDTLNQRIEGLVAELDAKTIEAAAAAEVAPAAPAAAPSADSADAEALKQRVAELEAQLAEKSANDSAISQALIVAQRSADEIVANARAEASNIIKDADEEADRIVGKAESDRQKIADAIRTLEADRSDVRAEYREMLSNFMADAQKKLAEIDGDARRANVTAQARSEANAAAYGNDAPAVPASAPRAASADSTGFIDKDFSGYGAADAEFEFDDID